MILAAGRGSRLRPLTDTIPKALIKINNKPLIFRHLENLRAIGIDEVVINLSYLPDHMIRCIGDGSQFGLKIQYSHEPDPAYGTAGGIRHALSHLSDEFIVINGDVLCDFDLMQLKLDDEVARVVLVPNPADNLQGDFALRDGFAQINGESKYTFAGIACYRKELFHDIPDESWYPLSRVLRQAMADPQGVSAILHHGQWHGINDEVGLTHALKTWIEAPQAVAN